MGVVAQIQSQALAGTPMTSIYKSPEEERLLQSCGECLAGFGLRVVDADLRIGPRSVVRLYVERVGDADLGKDPTASLEDCAQASRLVGVRLEAEDWIPSGYDLEVSSPGLDRRLRVGEDFKRVVGQRLKVDLKDGLWAQSVGLGRTRHLTGILVAVRDAGIVLNVDGQSWKLPLDQIVKAVRVWDWNSKREAANGI